MKRSIMTLSGLVVILALFLQLAGCGTLLYPERQKQPRGDIDPTVAILDGIGLLFFIIPGLIAFIVDFHTGAVYLPPGKSTEQRLKELKGSDLRFRHEQGRLVVYFDRDKITPAAFEQIIQATTGVTFASDHPELEVYKLDGTSRLHRQFEHFVSRHAGSTLMFN